MHTWTPTAKIIERLDEIYVEVTWGPEKLDRPSVGGWSFDTTAKQRSLAERLTKAINAGVVYKNPRKLTDIGGKTYISAEQTQFFHEQYMNKSLLAVGF